MDNHINVAREPCHDVGSRDRAVSEPALNNSSVTFHNTSAGGSASLAPGTPPPSRRSKLAASIGRFFRPWKWKRKKKSDKFLATSATLERKLSTRKAREELVERGILPQPNSNSEGDQTQIYDGQENGVKQLSMNGMFNNGPRLVTVKSAVVHAHGSPSLTPKGVEEDYVTQDDLKDSTGDPEWSPAESDEEEELNGVVLQWASKLKRTDSLAMKLKGRPSKKDLEDRNIIPVKTEEEKHECREQVGTKLTRRLSLRPSIDDLKARGIIKNASAAEIEKDIEQKKKILNRKLSRRPTVKELREKNILVQFSDYVEVVDVQEYDRRADKPWTRLTPQDKAAIRKELNDFKSNEMEVHAESKQYTRFHRP